MVDRLRKETKKKESGPIATTIGRSADERKGDPV